MKFYSNNSLLTTNSSKRNIVLLTIFLLSTVSTLCYGQNTKITVLETQKIYAFGETPSIKLSVNYLKTKKGTLVAEWKKGNKLVTKSEINLSEVNNIITLTAENAIVDGGNDYSCTVKVIDSKNKEKEYVHIKHISFIEKNKKAQRNQVRITSSDRIFGFKSELSIKVKANITKEMDMKIHVVDGESQQVIGGGGITFPLGTHEEEVVVKLFTNPIIGNKYYLSTYLVDLERNQLPIDDHTVEISFSDQVISTNDDEPRIYNLVQNGDFEAKKLEPWYRSGKEDPILVTDPEAPSGSKIVKVLENSGVYQDIALKPNTNYVFKAKIKGKYADKDVFMGVRDFGNTQKGISIWSDKFSTHEIQFRTGKNAHSARVFLWVTGGSGTGYIDVVSVFEEIEEKGDGILHKGIFQKYSSLDGLSQNNIHDIHQDQQGFMWFATNDGLNKFDGYNFTIYKPSKQYGKGPGSNLITGIEEDQQGNLWIKATEGGLNRFDQKKETFTTFYHQPENPKSLNSNTFLATFIDHTNTLWVATNKGIGYMPLKGTQEDSVQNFTYLGIPKNNISCITETKSGVLLMGTKNGELIKLKSYQDTIADFTITHSELTQIMSIVEDKFGRLIIGTANGIFLQDILGKNSYFINFDNGGAFNELKIDADEHLWAGSSINGLQEYTLPTKFGLPQKISSFKNNINDDRSLGNSQIISLEVDNKGIVWVGTPTGINKYNPNRLSFMYFGKNPNPKSLSAKKVSSILEDSNGGLWVGTSGGNLNYKHPGGKKGDYDNFIKLPISNVSTIIEGKSSTGNYILIGSKSGINYITLVDFFGLSPQAMMDNMQIGYYFNKMEIYDALIDKHQQIWLATNFGLFKWSIDPHSPISRTPLHYFSEKNSTTFQVTSLFQAEDGDLWIGSTQGLWRLPVDHLLDQYASFEEFTHESSNPNSLSFDHVLPITQDQEGAIWVGTLGGGINKVAKNEKGSFTFQSFTEENGLINNMIHGIEADDNGNLWISSNQGISKFNVKDFSVKNYDVDDGLQGSEFSDLASSQNANGKIYFGGSNGVNEFHPDSLHNKTTVPEVVITELQVNNKTVKPGDQFYGRTVLEKSISLTKEILLTYRENNFAIKFSALHYASPTKNQYKARLKGFNNEWVTINAELRTVAYTNLNPGSYQLEVIAANNDGTWNETPTILKIEVTPPWWETWWFRVFMLIAIVMAAFGYYKNRTYRLKERQRELERQVSDRTVELSQANKDLNSRHEEIKQQAEELQSQRDSLASKNELITEKNNLIETLSEIGQKITSSIDIKNVVQSMYDNINRLMDAPYFEIGVVNEEETEVIFYGYHENNNQVMNRSSLTGGKEGEKSFTEILAIEKKPIIINELTKEHKKYQRTVNTAKYLQKPYESIIYFPLLISTRLVGIMVIKSQNINAFEEHVLPILESIGDYATISVENARTYDIIQGKTEHITSSIRYAQTIQEAILPLDKAMQKNFKESFVLYRPKDIVSGDFYWMSEQENMTFLAAIDCTGHGVPGAFMSMIGSSILNRIVNERKIFETDTIIANLDNGIRQALKQDELKNDDGMDLIFCCFHKNEQQVVDKISYTGAKNSLYYYAKNQGQILEYKGDRKAIGGQIKNQAEFTSKTIEVQEGDVCYLLTDGILDQNRKDRKRYGKLRFLELLNDIAEKPLKEQYESMVISLDTFQGNVKQRDDITVIGVKP